MAQHSLKLGLHRHGEVAFAESEAADLLLRDASSVNDLIEFSFNHRISRVLLHSGNFDPEFFDLKSGLAGVILEKCRQYRLRLALVLDSSQQLGDRFRELMTEENKRPFVHFCDTVEEGRDWLLDDGIEATNPRKR